MGERQIMITIEQVIYSGPSEREARSAFHQAAQALQEAGEPEPLMRVKAIRHDLNPARPSLVGATFEVRIESQS
jgi:hypothetical protein